MENTTNKTKINRTSFLKRLKLKLFYSEMSISKILVQMTLAGLLIAVACVLELFVMVNAGPFELCLGFFVVLLFPLLLDFRIAVIAALVSVTITELAISGEGDFWIQYASIFLAFPIIKAFMLFDKKWMYAIGLVIGTAAYIVIAFFEKMLLNGAADASTYLVAKIIQMSITVPIALLLYYPIKRVMPKSTDNSWETDPCCEDCEPSVNEEQQCCADACTDGCKDK